MRGNTRLIRQKVTWSSCAKQAQKQQQGPAAQSAATRQPSAAPAGGTSPIDKEEERMMRTISRHTLMPASRPGTASPSPPPPGSLA